MNSIQGVLRNQSNQFRLAALPYGLRKWSVLGVVLASIATDGIAANLYLDANGSLSGAGGPTPTGMWGVDSIWSTSASGVVVPGGWTSGETAVFSAGTDANGVFGIGVSGTQVVGSILVEEGNPSLSGGVISLVSGASISVSATRSLSIDATVAGGAWSKVGPGMLSLGGVNTFTGPLTNTGNAIRFNNSGAAGTGAIIVSPTLDVYIQSAVAGVTLTNPIVLNSGQNVDVSSLAGTFTLDGEISGTRSLWSVGGQSPNTIVFGGNNTYSGNVEINGGTLIVTRDNALGTVGGTTKVSAGATLGFQGGLTYNAAEVIKLFGDGVSGLGSLRNVSGVNQFFGPIDLQSHVTLGATTGSLDLGGTISGSSFNITKIGAGRIIISGLGNSFGSTTISDGTLQVNTSLGSGPVSVSAGATLAGKGNVPGNVTLSGEISPAASPGKITTGSETWNPGASYLWEINDADFGIAGNSLGWDLVDIAGSLTISATPANEFTIRLSSLDPFFNLPNDTADFDNTLDYTFAIARTTGGIIGFDPAKFVLDGSIFSNDLGFGIFVVDTNATELLLRFVHPPFIVTQPTDATKECHLEAATFTVASSGSGSLSYQWKSNGVAIADGGRFSGANTATLSISPVESTDSGLSLTCTITNIYGVTNTAVAVLTVVDTTPPGLACPATVIVNADLGLCSASGVVLGSPTVLDQCDATPTVTNNATASYQVGTNYVTWGATDDSGNNSLCVQTVVVVDDQLPSLVLSPITRQLDVNGDYTLDSSDIAAIISAAGDNCGIQSTNFSQTVFNFCHVGVNNVTVTLTDVHGNASNAVVAITIDPPPTPAVVYVDDDYPNTCAAVNYPSNGVTGPYYVGFNAFNTIQAGIDAVASGGTVHVAAGTYTELVTVSKPVTVLGPNATINPNTGSRVSEAVVQPSSSDPDYNTSSVVLFYVESDDVVIRGLTLDGDNPALTSGVNWGGADLDAIEGIASYEGVGNILVENNIIKNLTYAGLDFYNYYNSGAATSGNSIRQNRFLNIGTTNYGAGLGILIYNNFYTDITDNQMVGVRVGIQTGNYYQANPGPTAAIISGNLVSSWRRGVFYNLHYASASPFTLTNNVFTAEDRGDVSLWDGVLVSSQQGSVTSVIGYNTINGSAATQLTVGYQVWNCPATAGAVFTGGTITDCDYGVWVNNYDGYNSTGYSTTATVNNVAISGASLAGVYVKDNPLNSNGATVHAILNGGSISNSVLGLLVDGPDASIAPGTVALGNLSGDYIDLVDASASNANATSVAFDGLTGAGMSLAQLFATEDRIDHATDTVGLGLVRVKAANVYVTTSSGSIQRGINPATAGDTVNVNDGIYDGKVTINKAVALLSANGSVLTTIQDSAPTGLGTIQVVGPTTGVQIGASGRGFTVNGIDSPAPGIEWAAIYFQGNHTNAAVIGNTVVAAGDAGLQSEFGAAINGVIISENEFSGQTFMGPNPADYGFANQFSTPNVPRQLVVLSGGSGGGSHYNISFTCNTVSGAAGGINTSAQPQGNTLVTIDATGATIENNVFTGVTTRFAESLRIRGPNGIVAGNTFAGSSPVAVQIYIPASPTAHFTNNSFVTSYPVGLANLGTLLDAQNNWWGSASGPNYVANPGGAGVPVAGTVDVSPWLGSTTDIDGACGFQPNLGLVYYLPHHLNFVTQPGDAALGAPLSSQPVVHVIDENGGLATQFNGSVTLTIGNNPGGGVLTGTTSQLVSGGVATFSGLAITVGGGDDYSLVAATASPVIAATSTTFDIGNPVPVITSLNPFWKRAGDGNFVLTVTGSDFVPNSIVLWNGSTRPTTYVGPSTVTASIPATDIATVGTASVNVSNPPTAGGVSGALTFRIEAAVPAIVYVDDDYSNNAADDLVNFPDNGGVGTHIIGYDAFATIQGGITAVTNTGTEYVAVGTYNEDVSVNKTVSAFGGFGGESLVIGPIGGSGSSTFSFASTGAAINGFTITRAGNNPTDWNNPNLNSAGVAVQGLTVNCTVRNCLITGMRTAIDINNSNGSIIQNNVITNNRTGLIMRNQTDNMIVTENIINDNWTVGVLFLDASGGSNVPVQTALNCLFASNSISGNWYGQIVDRQTGGSLPAPGANLKNFSGNWLGTSSPVVSMANSAEPGYAALIPVFYGGAAVPPGGQPDICGTASANFDYTPWLHVGTDTSASIGFQGDFSTLHVDDSSAQIGAVTRIQEGVNMVSGSTVLVEPGAYSENVVITDKITIDGAGSGTGAGDSIVMAANAALPVFVVTDAGGTGAGDRLTIQDLRVTGGADGVRVNAATGLHQWYRFDNVAAVNNTGSGIALAGVASLGEVEVVGSVLSNNGVYGLQVDDTLTSFAALFVSGGSMADNGANGLAVNGTDANISSPTQIAVSGTVFTNNGNPADGGAGDVSFYLFNGDAGLTNVSITADGRNPIQFRGKGSASPATWLSAGTIRLENVTLTGTASRPGLYIIRYTNVANISFEAVDLSGFLPPVLPSAFASMMQVEHTGATPLDLHGLTLKATYVGGPPSGYGALAMLASGGAVADCTTVILGANTVSELEASVYDQQDQPLVGDVVFPTLTLTPVAPNVIAECTGGGAAVVTFTAPTVAADCAPGGPVVCTPASGSSFNLGTNVVTCWVTDGRGISNSATFLVTVLDTIAPDILSCAPATNVVADANCLGTVPNLTGLVVANDGCGSGSLLITQLPTAGSTLPLGSHPLTLTVTDPSGNFSNCVTTVTVVDQTAPLVTFWPTNRTLSVGAGCDIAVPNLAVEVLAADNCGAVTVTQNPLAGTLVSYGVTAVTVTVADAYSNATNHITALTIVDTTNPGITCPLDVTVNRLDAADPFATGYATATDNCTNVTVTYNDNRAGLTNCNASGIIYRTWTATDGASNVTTCVQTITIIDTVAPLYTTTQPNITTTNDTGNCSAVVVFPTPTAVDVGYAQGFESPAWVSGDYLTAPSVDWNDYNSGMVRVASGTDGITSKSGAAHAVIDSTTLPASPDDFSGVFGRLGGFSSVFGSGYRVSLDVYLNVNDPAVVANTYGWDLSVAASSQSGGHLRDFIFHTASDAGGNIVVAADNNSNFVRRNDLASINHHTVSSSGWYTFEWVFRDNGSGVLAVDCNLRDAGGTLLWTEVRSAPSDLIATVVGGNRYMWFTFLAADKLAVDNAYLERNATVVCTPVSGFAFPAGTNTVTCVASDACGNTTTNYFTVTVNDVELPTITCPPNILQSADAGVCEAVIALGAPVAGDNCGVATVSNDAVSQTTFPVGTNTVVWTVTDIHGNSNTCAQTVIILDTENPTIACPANIVVAADPGVCSTTLSLGLPVVGDNCGVAGYSNNAVSQTVFPVGVTSVTWTVTDIHGNSNSCVQTVTVLDNQLPQLTMGAFAACYETATEAETAALLATIATDNCGLTNVVAVAAGTCTATVTVTAYDESGNSNAVVYNTRIDPTAPTIGAVAATEVQLSGSVNVKDNDCITNAVVQGVVQIAVTASDNCSFVGGQPSIALVNGPNNETATFVNESPAGTFNYTWTVTSATANGTWTATVTAADLCHTTATNFTMCVNKTQITGLVQLEGFTGTGTNINHKRLVTFVATGGLTNKTWNLTLTNASGDTFSYTLADVPAGTTGLSAKTAWNLREKLAVALDINGQATADFIADGVPGWSDATDHYLRGADISAANPLLRDNQVQFFDYTVLGTSFFTYDPVADITGDGPVDYDDYYLLYLNYFKLGDPE